MALVTASVIAINIPWYLSANTKIFQNKPYSGTVLRVAIMGLGSYGTRVAEAMKDCKKAKLVGVISGTPSKIKDWQAKYNIPEKNCYNYETFDQVKNNPDIDAVYVITPNALHHHQVIRVAKAGKHVICEKPMSINAKDGQEMVDACKKANVKLLVGYRMHFEPKTLEIIRMRKAGELGKVLFFQGLCGFTIGDPTQWRLKKALAGGGAMMDVGVYAIQAARYVTGEEPLSVTAQEFKTDPIKFKEVDETIFWQLEFPSGAVSTSSTSYASSMERLFVSAENGWLELRPAYGYGPLAGRTSKGELNLPQTNHQALQMDDFAKCIQENRESSVAGEEGLKDMKVVEAIYRAIASGKKEKI